MVAHSPRLNLDALFAVGHGSDFASPAAPVAAPATVSGFAATCSIATLNGPVPAAALAVGDRVLTRDQGYARILDIISFQDAAAVSLPSGQFGLTAGLTVAADTAVLLVDDCFSALFGTREVMVPAAALGTAAGRQSGFGIVLEQPGLIAADGLWAEASCRSGGPARPLLAGREAEIAIRLCGQGAATATRTAA